MLGLPARQGSPGLNGSSFPGGTVVSLIAKTMAVAT
jgi:hypothetical protein